MPAKPRLVVAVTNKNEVITIDWASCEPALPVRRWHIWELDRVVEAAGLSDSSLDDRLGWPRGTVGVLQAAFASGLSRGVGWQGEPIDTDSAGEYWPVVQAAAGVYRRGVAYRQESADEVTVRRQAGRYAVTVHADQLKPEAVWAPGCFPIVDAQVARLWPALPHAAEQLAMTLTEHEKTLQTVALIIDTWRVLGCPKRWVVIGGGLLADVAAFAAAQTGSEVSFLPTTLLAMADACVGGKTGVNFPPYGKNQVGSFFFPVAVEVWPDWLSTLPPRHWRAGGIECIKHAFLLGDLELARDLAAAAQAGQLAAMRALLPRVIRCKAEIVAEDPTETARRAVLNLGHTLAHALEAQSHAACQGDEAIHHGEAVAVGLVYALLLSQQLAGLPADAARQMREIVAASGALPSPALLQQQLGGIRLSATETFVRLWEHMLQDKKRLETENSVQAFVLLRGVGVVARGPGGAWTVPVPMATAAECWESLLSLLPKSA